MGHLLTKKVMRDKAPSQLPANTVSPTLQQARWPAYYWELIRGVLLDDSSVEKFGIPGGEQLSLWQPGMPGMR